MFLHATLIMVFYRLRDSGNHILQSLKKRIFKIKKFVKNRLYLFKWIFLEGLTNY